MSFEVVQRKSSGPCTTIWNKLMSKDEPLKSEMTFLACDVQIAASRMSRETTREVSSNFARGQYNVAELGR